MAEIKPRVRFSGFCDNWEQHKLSNYFTERVERSAEGELISVTINSGVMRAADLGRHDNSSEDKSHYKRVEVGDIAYNSMRMWQGASGYSPYSGILSPAYTVAKPQEEVDSLFFAYMFKKPELIHQFEIKSQGLTKDTWNLKFPAFSEIEVAAPAYDEQIKISEYLHTLDHLFTLHQQKYDKLVNLEKSLLDKMFPKNGADMPEIRFARFNGEWEHHKVGEVVTVVERPIDMKDDEVYQLVTVKRRNEGVVSRGFLKGKDILVKNYFEIRAGDYIISKRQVIHGANGLVPESLDKSVVSNEYLVIVSNDIISAKFWTLISKRREMYRMFLLSSYGVDVEKMVFNVGDWKKRSFTIPSITEQNRIVELFDHLDHHINLHQRKLEKLRKLKKSMLERLFV